MPRPPRRPEALLTRLLVVAVLLAGGCGGEPAPPLARYGLGLAANAAPAPRTKVVEHFDIVANIDEWTFNVPDHRVLTVPEFRPGEEASLVGMTADGPATPMRVRRQGSYDLSSFNRIELPFIFDGRGRLAIEFHRDGKKVGETAEQVFGVLKQQSTMTLDVPRELAAEAPCDGLVISCRGPVRRLGIRELSLLMEPAAASLPDPAEGGGLVRVGAVSRRAVGLSPHRAVTLGVAATSGMRLGFALGLPEKLRRPGSKAEIVVTLGEQEVMRLPLTALMADTSWHEEELALDDWSGQDVVARFELIGDLGAGDVVALTEPVAWVPDRQAPLVVLITTDTHRADHMGFSEGGVDVATPVVDALAARGLRFSDCFTPANVTNPSHVALLTGVHARQTGVLSNFTHLSDDAPTLAEAFAAQGWQTVAALCAQHLGPERSGLGQGFDRVSWPPDKGQRPAREAIADVVGWLDDIPDRPLFVWLHVFDPHWPYDPDADDLARYYDPAKDPSDPSIPDHGIALNALEPVLHEVRDLDYPKAQYRAEITAQDAALAAVLERPRVQNGVVALVSDHGEGLGEKGAWFKHVGLYPGVLHVPLVFAGPGVPEGAVCAVPVTHLDVGRTLLDLADLGDVAFPGRNMVTVASGNPRILPRFAVEGYGLSASVTHEGLHLVLNLIERRIPDVFQDRELHEVELYDLTTDPECLANVVDERPEDARRLRQRLIDWLVTARDLGWSKEAVTDSEFVGVLEQLGYVAPDDSPEDSTLWTPDECPWCRRFP